MTKDLTDLRVAVVAGDDRMLEVMRQARSAGAEVVGFATAPGTEEASGQPVAATLDAALEDAALIILPVPGLGPDDSLWTPNATEPVKLTTSALAGTAAGCAMFMGRVSDGIEALARENGVTAIAHGDDDAEALYHAVPTAEGAIRHAIEMSDVTIMDGRCVVTGFGRVGQSMAWLARQMGAHVTVCARNPSQLARAWGFGMRAVHLRDLAGEVADADFIFQTIPGLDGYTMHADILGLVRSDAVLVELSSPPSGTDLAVAESLGLRAVWARGQAGSAPRTAGSNEWRVIMRMYAEHLEAAR